MNPTQSAGFYKLRLITLLWLFIDCIYILFETNKTLTTMIVVMV